MKKQCAWTAACGILVLAALVSPAARAQGGASPEVDCAGCHDQPATWAGKSSVHAPVKEGRCLSCHNPHASRHGGLLRRETGKLCLSCHEGIFEGRSPADLHGAVESEKGCLSCHDPHAAGNSHLLASPPAELCAACHERFNRLAEAPYPHPPAQEGECMLCHDAHGSPRPALAREAEAELCGSCHDAAEPVVRTAHKGLLTATATCSACHDPHGSTLSGIIHSSVHAPFQEGLCESCHTDSTLSAGELRSRSTETCAACHEAGRPGHPVPGPEGCVSCHAPHASRGTALLAGRESRLCGACHEGIDVRRRSAASSHPPIGGTRDCTTCHQLHEGETPVLLSRTEIQELCSTCHDTHSQFSHPMGKGVADPSRPGRIVDCLSCHDPHGTPYETFLVADPRRELCIRCHVETGR